MEKKVTWRFIINGTDENWTKENWGLRFNPFPQHGMIELYGPDLALQSLAEENMTPAEIRRRLKPYFNDQFINSVVSRYKAGEIVHCEVTCSWEEGKDQ